MDPTLSAFVPSCWIAENVVLAQEVVHNFKKSKKKKGAVGFKLDFYKAYDRQEWNFIITVLKALGFDQKVTNMIFQCISTVSFTLLLSGRSSSFSPSRGIRQGDPLSPYLFILCSEVLSQLIYREVDRGNIKSIKVASGAPGISNLLYADDVLLFYGAQHLKVSALMKCVEKYCDWSRQVVSRDKSRIFVSKGVHSQFVQYIKNQWGFKLLPKGVKYLDMPLFISLNKTKDFSFVKEKLESQISGWKCKSLSWMGRATLIKSVAQSTPLYCMSSFKFPKRLCDELDSIVRKFWWTPHKNGNRLYTLVAWLELCKPLLEGMLGFRTFESFNEAMIAKLAWWVLSNRDSFCVTVLRAKYKVGNKWLNTRLAKSASFTWRGIEGA